MNRLHADHVGRPRSKDLSSPRLALLLVVLCSLCFASDVCAGEVAAATSKASSSASITLTVTGKLEAPLEGVPLNQVTLQYGKPLRVTESRYTCDSAFEKEGAKEYFYPTFTFETDGETAVLRSMKIDGSNRVALPQLPVWNGYSEAEFRGASELQPELLEDHTYRISPTPGGDLESAYDFIFVDGKLDRIEYWIGC